MGIYHRGISKRVRTIQGVTFAYANFYGKAPIWNADKHRAWNTFCTKSANAREFQLDAGTKYVAMAQTPGEMAEMEEVPIAKWNGQGTMTDAFWDTNIVGKVYKIKGRWVVEFYITKDSDDAAEEWSPENADYCDKGSIHHY